MSCMPVWFNLSALCILSVFVVNLKLVTSLWVKVGHKEHNVPQRAQRTNG